MPFPIPSHFLFSDSFSLSLLCFIAFSLFPSLDYFYFRAHIVSYTCWVLYLKNFDYSLSTLKSRFSKKDTKICFEFHFNWEILSNCCDLLTVNPMSFNKILFSYRNGSSAICCWNIQAFLDFCGFDFCDFWFNAIYNSTLFCSPLILLNNLNLRS